MVTRILKIDPQNIDYEQLKVAAGILQAGGTVAFPTETVYGLGANAFDASAVARIFEAKGRPADNPLIVHISRFEQMEALCSEIPPSAARLAANFWPGPITMILKKKPAVPDIVTASLDTVAVRIPAHPVAYGLIDLAGVPVAAPSANLSGSPSPTAGGHVIEDMNGRADAVIDGGGCDFGIESTVVDLTEDKPLILRPGAITREDLREFLPEADYAPGVLDKLPDGVIPKSPGMKYRHYAPKAAVISFEGNPDKVRAEIEGRLAQDAREGVKAGVLAALGAEYKNPAYTVYFRDAAELAKILFATLREFDAKGIERVYCEPVAGNGMAVSVKNRLYKSAGYNIVRLP